MPRSSLLALALCLVFTSHCLAQPADSAGQLRAFGNKMVEGTWHQQVPKDVSSKHTYQWALGKEYLLVHMWHKDKPNAIAVIGIDPETNLQTWWTYRDDGSIGISAVEVETRTPTQDQVKVAGPNPANRGTFEVVWKDANNTLEIIPGADAKENGAPARREVWTRSTEVDDVAWIDAVRPAEIPEQLSLLPHFSGRKWIDGVTPEGSKMIGGGFGKWILKGKFHLFTGSTAIDDHTTWSHLLIDGIDPQTDEAAAWEFTSNGAKSSITYDNSGMTIYGANTRSNGEKYQFEGHFTVDGDTLKYKSKIGKEGEEPLPYGWNYRNAE